VGLRFELGSAEDRKKAFRELWRAILGDLARGRVPTYHVVVVEEGNEGTEFADHYMTPVSLEPVDDRGSIGVWAQDFEFFLKLLLRLRNVVAVEYVPERPAVVFTYVHSCGCG